MGEGMSTKNDAVADAIRFAAKWLGTGDAASTMGALEWVGVCIKEASETIASPFHAIADHFESIAYSLESISISLRAISKRDEDGTADADKSAEG